MSEENVDNAGTGDNQSAADNAGGDSSADNTATNNDQSGDQSGQGDQNDQGDQKKDNDSSENKSSTDDQPPVRKTKAEYIKERQEKKAVKDAGEGGEAAEIHPDDEAIVSKVIDQKFGSVLARINDQAIAGEVKEFVEANPQFKGHENKIKSYANHEAYSRLPIEQVAYAAVGKSLLKVGADAARTADVEAAESATGGGANRNVEGSGKDYANMSDEDMEIEIAKAKGQI